MIFTLGQTQFESLEEINRFSESGEQPAPMQMQYSASLEVGMASADEAETSGREHPEAGGFERSSSGSQRESFPVLGLPMVCLDSHVNVVTPEKNGD